MASKDLPPIENEAAIIDGEEATNPLEYFKKVAPYLKVARIDHWFKNIFMVLGMIVAIAQNDIVVTLPLILKYSFAVLLACFVSSANYVINEIWDAEFDRRHPNKKFRSVATGNVSVRKLVFLEILLVTVSMGLSYIFLNPEFSIVLGIFFIIGGVFYNIPPIRTKDLPLIDVLGESINNPLRLLLGWFAVVSSINLPLTGIISYWSFGAMLVTAKRLAEFRHFGDQLVLYRPTFRYYNNSILIFMYFAFGLITLATFVFLGINYNFRLFFVLPLLLIFLIWFSVLTFQKNSIVKEPERIFEKKLFAAYCFLSLVVFTMTMLL
ncbi:UbiA family prenyltransferase [bacterium]|nr:UbiA family prenyltransferase [bacterium]MCI0606193.1 UbiA family prenyltransferase [bacterium]